MTQRRFPPPWTVEEQAACFVVRDHNGQQLEREGEFEYRVKSANEPHERVVRESQFER